MTDIRAGDIVQDCHHLIMGTALKPITWGNKWHKHDGWLVKLFPIYEGGSQTIIDAGDIELYYREEKE